MSDDNAAKNASATTATTTGGGSGKTTIILIALAVINMVIIGGVGIMLWKSREKEKEKPGIEQVIQGESETHDAEGKNEKEEKRPIMPLESFIVNLAGSKGRQVAKVDIELELNGEKAQAELEQRAAQVRDIIIMILSSKTYEYVSEKEGKNQLREEIKDTINAFLSKGKIEGVYFTNFIYN